MLDLHGHPRLRGQGGMATRPRLDAGFLIGRQDEVIGGERPALPDPLIEVEDAPGFPSKVGIARKDPTPVLPGANRVFMQPTPYCAALRVATSPERRASAASSATLQRARGWSDRLGSSHARALTCTTTSGGKSPGAPRPRPLFEAREAILEKSLAPQADHFAPSMQHVCDLVVGATLGGEEDHLGADDNEIRQRIFCGAAA